MSQRQASLNRSSQCPYCNSKLLENRCLRCGVICQSCGRPYSGGACPDCGDPYDAPSPARRQSSFSFAETHGEVAPSSFDKIVRTPSEGSVSRKEKDMLRGTFVDRESKAVHDRVVAACSMLNFASEVRGRFQERVELQASRLVRKSTEIGVEEAVKFAVLVEAKSWGRKLSEVQSALARAGFKIRVDSVFLDVASRNIRKVKIAINREQRRFRVLGDGDARVKALVRAHDLKNHRVHRVKLQLRLQDTLEGSGPPQVSAEGGYFVLEDRGQVTQVVYLSEDSRCFSLFKTAKFVAVDNGWAPTFLNTDAFIRSALPSKKLPASTAMMRRYGYLNRFESLFTQALRDALRDSHGRSPNTLAVEALYGVDTELFPLLSPNSGSLPLLGGGWRFTSGERRDREYTGYRGLLIPSEVERAFGS